MDEFWYYLIGAIPGGWIPIFSILLIFLVSLAYTKIRNPQYPNSLIKKYLLYILFSWLLLFGIVRINFPPPAYPIRLAVYPLLNEKNDDEMSYQLSRELEEAISSTNYRWTVGAFQRLSWRPIPAKEIPDTISQLPKLLKLKWLVTGQWRSNDSVKKHLELNLTLSKINSNVKFEIRESGSPNEVIRNVADKIAEFTQRKIEQVTFQSLSPEWRRACAQTFSKNRDTTVTAFLFQKAIQSDSLCLIGYAWWIEYLCKSKQYQRYLPYLKDRIPNLLKFAETYPLFLNSIGDFYRLIGEADKAISAFLLANHYAPTKPEPHYFLALLNRSEAKTKFQKSNFAHLLRAIELDPGYESARLKLLSLIQPSGLSRDIENYILPGLEIAPYSKELLLMASYFQLERFPPEEVIQTLDKLISIDSIYANAYYNRGIAKLRAKDTIGAKNDFYQTIRKQGSVEAYYYLGLIYEMEQQWDSAIFYYNHRIKFAKQATDQIATQRARDKLLYLLRKHRSMRMDEH